jgi:hypothetical protein
MSSHTVSAWWCAITFQSWNASVTFWKLSWTLDCVWMWSTSFLVCMHTWLEPSRFCVCACMHVCTLKNQGLCQQLVLECAREELWCQIQWFAGEITNTPKIFEWLFLFHTELNCVHEHGGHFKHLLYESKQFINSPFIFFLHTTC